MKKIIFATILLILGAAFSQAQEKKLLPHRLITSPDTITFSYDDQNRLTKVEVRRPARYPSNTDRFNYEDLEYEGYELTKNYRTLEMKIQKKTKSEIETKQEDSEHSETEKTFKNQLNEQGKITKQILEITYPGYDWKQSFPIDYEYDKQGNVVSLNFPYRETNNKLIYLDKRDIKYDDKNGIFKNIDLTPLDYIFDGQEDSLLYFLFLNNNPININNRTIEYTYNEDNYPLTMKTDMSFLFYPEISIEYIEAK